jgi:cyanate lyase
MEKSEAVAKLLAAKEASGKTYDEIADPLGYCNVYVAQLFQRQAQLKPGAVSKIKELVPGLTDDLISEMQKCPMRSYDPSVIQEPNIYRMTEVCLHYGIGIKDVMNEIFGDGIMSAIDFKLTVKKVVGDKGEDRMVVTMNGKFLPHIEQTQ